MAEATSNIEFAHKIHEAGHHPSSGTHRQQWIEIAEAVVLAVVAVATAWSGYDGEVGCPVGRAVPAGVAHQRGIAGKGHALAQFYERRFRPEYALAFMAWQKLDPAGDGAVADRAQRQTTAPL